MAENDSTLSRSTIEEVVAIPMAEHDAELTDVQSRLDRLMSSGDDQTKRLIFSRVIRQMSEALPNLPPVVATKQNETASASARKLLDAADILREATFLAEFIQSISLNVSQGCALTLQPGQLTGFYYAMESTIDRIKEAEKLIDAAREQPEALRA